MIGIKGGFMKSDREVLEAAIELIENPEHWAQNALALTATGYPAAPRSTRAQSWCAIGALRRVCQDLPQVHRIIGAIVGAEEPCQLMTFNDTHLHGEVILLMKQGLDKL